MIFDSMSTDERDNWYKAFIEEANKIGKVDPVLLHMKRSVVEMLRVESKADPEDAAYGYMAVQARAKERRSSPTNNDQFLPNGVAVEDQIAFEKWFVEFCRDLGANLNSELESGENLRPE